MSLHTIGFICVSGAGGPTAELERVTRVGGASVYRSLIIAEDPRSSFQAANTGAMEVAGVRTRRQEKESIDPTVRRQTMSLT